MIIKCWGLRKATIRTFVNLNFPGNLGILDSHSFSITGKMTLVKPVFLTAYVLLVFTPYGKLYP